MWELVLALVVLVAFVFLLTNGMNDASAVVATMIACGAATPLQAVLWAASVGLVGAIFSGAAVAQTGLIGFVGLVAPHLARSMVRCTHGPLLLLSTLAGGLLLVLADIVARLLVAPQELPVGVLTAVLGGAYLLWLMGRRPGAGGAA